VIIELLFCGHSNCPVGQQTLVNVGQCVGSFPEIWATAGKSVHSSVITPANGL
jgi:hypothetical protein